MREFLCNSWDSAPSSLYLFGFYKKIEVKQKKGFNPMDSITTQQYIHQNPYFYIFWPSDFFNTNHLNENAEPSLRIFISSSTYYNMLNSLESIYT